MMMRMRTKAPSFSPIQEKPSAATFAMAGKIAAAVDAGSGSGGGSSPQQQQNLSDDDSVWEVRPGGMLVQKRNPDSAAAGGGPPAPTIRVRVKYGSSHHEIYLSSQATFGELKKLVAAQTGLHPEAQKVLYKDKERESSAFLDMAGVKDKSKVVVVEDPAGQARRCLELRRAAKLDMAAKSLSHITHHVDKLASQVSALEAIVAKGKKVAESDVVGLTEQLMNQLIKLDGIVADGDVKLQRRMQVKRVQKFVETLDVLKVKNSLISNDPQTLQQQQQNGNHYHQQQEQKKNNNHYQQHQQHQQRQYVQPQQRVSQPPVVVTTNWETFDLLSGPSTSAATTTTTKAATVGATPAPRFDWELF